MNPFKLLAGGGIGVVIYILIAAAILGFCFDYSLGTYFGKDIPWYGDVAAGVVASPVAAPAAIIGYVLVECDVPTPIFCPTESEGE